jgi:transcriptional regulator with XRE-family HTH domain
MPETPAPDPNTPSESDVAHEEDADVSQSLEEYGLTMRRNRQILGLSVRDAALRAGVSKNTVLRLEAGLPVTWSTHVKVSKAYGRVPARPEARKAGTEQGAHFSKQPFETRPWIPVRVDKNGVAEIFSDSQAVPQDERNRMGWYGVATHFLSPLRCRRESSRFIPMITEIFARTDLSSDLSGERFFLGLRGRVRIVVGDESFELGEGEAATIDATKVSGLEPSEPLKPGDPAPLVLQVVLP